VFQRRAVDIRAKYGPAMMIALFRNRVVYARGGGGGALLLLSCWLHISILGLDVRERS
jgi:hypothetical protein